MAKNIHQIKHKAAPKVHQHTQLKAPSMGVQFADLLEKTSRESVPSFLTLDALNNALIEAMQGLTKLVAVTILKNDAT